MLYPAFYNSIPLSLEHIQNALTDACGNRNSPFRTMNICYIYQHKPYCRTVVLRYCQHDLSYLQFHTDYRSPKIQALLENPEIAIHFYDSQSKIQLVFNGIARIHYADDIAQTAWEKTQILSRRCYLTQYPPSTIISEPTAGFDSQFADNTQTQQQTEHGYGHFAVVKINIQAIDWVYLHAHGNRRIIFTKNNTEFAGQWCIP